MGQNIPVKVHAKNRRIISRIIPYTRAGTRIPAYSGGLPQNPR
jgi:hypothetical protein